MNRNKSIFFVIGIAVTALLLAFVLNEGTIWMSMAQISPMPTPTFTPTPVPPTSTPTNTPVPPTSTPTNTPVPPTSTPTNTPVPPTSTPTNTPVPPTPTSTPSDDSVTGKGWINSPAGAYVEDASLMGEAAFSFVARYKKNTSVPTGNAKFVFRRANLDFRADVYEQLVVDGDKAMFNGTGRIKGAGSYEFLIAVVDAGLAPGIGVDLFRIKIWDENNGGAVVYDSQIGCADLSDDAVPCRAIAGGDIVIGK
jgi:cytoskeletal protein RodZ